MRKGKRTNDRCYSVQIILDFQDNDLKTLTMWPNKGESHVVEKYAAEIK